MADPVEQLRLSVIAVFESWNSSRAVKYRSINQISGLNGTAVNIQAMVFGNMGGDSGTGVLFTRNPSTGEKKLYGEYLINAQVSYLCVLIVLQFQLTYLSCRELWNSRYILLNVVIHANFESFKFDVCREKML